MPGKTSTRTSNMIGKKRKPNRVRGENNKRLFKASVKNWGGNKNWISMYGKTSTRKFNMIEKKRKPNRVRGENNERLFKASVKIWGGNKNWIRSVTVREEGEHFYSSLLKNYVADKGLNFASLDDATLEIFVEKWRELMLAEAHHDILKAKFERKVCECKRHVYKDELKISATSELKSRAGYPLESPQ